MHLAYNFVISKGKLCKLKEKETEEIESENSVLFQFSCSHIFPVLQFYYYYFYKSFRDVRRYPERIE